MLTPAQKQFSILWFVIEVAVQFGAPLTAFRLLFPDAWGRQLAAGWPAFAMVVLVVHMGMAFFEWAFHRYVLHAATLPWLAKLTRAHRHHHALTPIRLQPVAPGSDRCVLDRYPIVETPQFEDSAFPIYSTLAFWALFTPGPLVAQWLLPTLSVLVGGYTAITLSMTLYEILHAIEHQPFTWWKRATESHRFGLAWRRLYGFHHMHHANVPCNEAISGFFGLPVPDWLLGTYHQPRELLLEGRVATARDFTVAASPRVVRWIDAWAHRRESRFAHGRQPSRPAK